MGATGTIWLVGAGNMGGAMLRGWIAEGMDPARITVIDPFAKNVPQGVAVEASLPAGGVPDVLVLAVKPQQLGEVRDVFAARGGLRLLVSVLAGVETATLGPAFGAVQVVRVMPNLPASIGQGVTVLFGDPAVRDEAARLMAPLGQVEWIDDEAQFHAVTALSGSGPGYVFRVIDAMAQAGAALGLDPALAMRLAIGTVRGSAALAAGSAESPAVLADRVASPGGTTREGLNVLDADGAIMALMARTLAAAARRSEELAAAARS